jgi:chromosome segregation ATPase
MSNTSGRVEKSKKEKQAIRQKIKNLFYLLKQRNNAINYIKTRKEKGSPEMIEWEKIKAELEEEKKSLTELYIKKYGLRIDWNEEIAKQYKHAVRNILRKTSSTPRAEHIDKRFKDNVERHVKSLELQAARDKDSLRELESDISRLKERLKDLVAEICEYAKDKLVGSPKWKQENASDKIANLESEVIKIQKSIEISEKELLELKPKASRSHEKAKLLREEMGNTVESFISYLERLNERMEKQFKCEDLDESISNRLKDFEKTVQFIRIIEGLSEDVESNLQQICDAVTASSRFGIHVSFDMCTRRINLILNGKTYHDLTLIGYLTYLKDETRPMDINDLEDSLKQLTVSIESLSALVPDFKNLTNKIAHFQKNLAEKKRMFNCLRK